MRTKLQRIWDLLTGKRKVPAWQDGQPIGCVIEQIIEKDRLIVKVRLNETGKKFMEMMEG